MNKNRYSDFLTMKTTGDVVTAIKKGLTNMNYPDPAGTDFEWIVTDTIAVLMSIVPSFANQIKDQLKVQGRKTLSLQLIPSIRPIKDAAEIAD